MQLHLGCWTRNIPGFVNIDLCDLPHIHYKSSIDRLPMIENESVELIYSSHSFEYFDRLEAVEILKEWHRVLKPGGILRLAVPDFDKLIQVYEISGRLENILGPLFGRMPIETESGTKVLYHKSVYNYASLKDLLENNGFESIKKYDWRDTIHKDYDDHSQAYYPHMEKESGLLISLNIEAIKW